jgi:hypothetical protein
MVTRTTRKMIEFRHPFKLDGIEEELPAGFYNVETEEEQIESLSFTAYRRIETTIVVPASGTPSLKKQVIAIDPQDLAAAHDRDEKLVEMSRAQPRTTSRA